MQEIYVGNIKDVIKNKKFIEKKLEIVLFNRGKIFFIDGNASSEYIALDFFNALSLGFSVEKALKIKDEGMAFRILNIKDLTKKHDLKRIRARIIGTRGKTIKTLHELTECDISLKDNRIGIIGEEDEIEDAVDSIKSLIQGSKHGKVYSKLEGQRRRKRLKRNFNNFKIIDKV